LIEEDGFDGCGARGDLSGESIEARHRKIGIGAFEGLSDGG
jgi:hypothetical protein